MPGLLFVDIKFFLWAGDDVAGEGLLGVFDRHFPFREVEWRKQKYGGQLYRENTASIALYI